jgi:hypothetical protein
VTASGDIVERWNGFLTGDQLTKRIEELIEVSAGS